MPRKAVTVEHWQFAKAAALIALMVCATILDVHGRDAGGIWFLIVLWIVFGEWK
jgi:hypothetical protein